MMVCRGEGAASMQLGAYSFECVSEFKYLGFMIDRDMSVSCLVAHRERAARGALVRLGEFVRVQ